jgi:RNA polymerase sigma-70 factor (ECF subfamily)
VAGAVNGDRVAMQALWAEHRRWIAAVLLAHKSPHDQLDDLLQDVAMTLVSKINTLRDPRNARAWLRTVAVNTARASARSRRSRPVLATLGQEPPSADRADDDNHVVDDQARRLMLLARELPDAYREPLMLRAVHGMRGRHIAEILDLPEATVETRIARARRMLRDAAEADQRETEPPAVVASIAVNVNKETSHDTGT